MARKQWIARERVDMAVKFVSTNIGAGEICRKYGIPQATLGNSRRMFMDADRRELAGIGGDDGGDPAKAMAGEIRSLKIIAASRRWPSPR